MNREAEKQRLVELADSFLQDELCVCLNKDILEKFAQHCLDKGAIVPPCKVGDVVWLIGNMKIYTKEVICSRKIISIQKLRTGETLMHFKDGCFPSDAIGVFVFYTREEAEKALRKEDEKNVGI